MSGEDDLFDDILPMVLSGILGPRYLTGEAPEAAGRDEEAEKDEGREAPFRDASPPGPSGIEAAPRAANRSQRGKP